MDGSFRNSIIMVEVGIYQTHFFFFGGKYYEYQLSQDIISKEFPI